MGPLSAMVGAHREGEPGSYTSYLSCIVFPSNKSPKPSRDELDILLGQKYLCINLERTSQVWFVPVTPALQNPR